MKWENGLTASDFGHLLAAGVAWAEGMVLDDEKVEVGIGPRRAPRAWEPKRIT